MGDEESKRQVTSVGVGGHQEAYTNLKYLHDASCTCANYVAPQVQFVRGHLRRIIIDTSTTNNHFCYFQADELRQRPSMLIYWAQGPKESDRVRISRPLVLIKILGGPFALFGV